ncbi:MAG: helix-hairpin-helix domain-containing protein, partial [Candidatus Desantisbacteria bacterium]
HNEDEIKRKDIRVGDRVIIERSGDVIPKVIEVIPADVRTEPFIFPTNCPICGEKTERKDGEAKVYCSGRDCLGQLKKRIEYFAKRDCMDIEGLGEKIVAQLIDNGLISDLPDLYRLKKESLLELEGWQEKSATNLIEAIEKSKKRPLCRLISGLGIPHIGTATAFTLAERFGSISKLAKASYDELINLPDIGPKVAGSILLFFSSGRTSSLVSAFSEANVGTEAEKPLPYKGMQFVITGTLPEMSRDEAKRLIESLGGQLKDSLSQKIDFLIVGENPGSKLKIAEKIGIKIMSAEEFTKKMVKLYQKATGLPKTF